MCCTINEFILIFLFLWCGTIQENPGTHLFWLRICVSLLNCFSLSPVQSPGPVWSCCTIKWAKLWDPVMVWLCKLVHKICLFTYSVFFTREFCGESNLVLVATFFWWSSWSHYVVNGVGGLLHVDFSSEFTLSKITNSLVRSFQVSFHSLTILIPTYISFVSKTHGMHF